VTKEQLIEAVVQAEANGPLASRQAVWQAVAETPMSRFAGLTANALKAKARKWGIEPKTPPSPGAARRRTLMEKSPSQAVPGASESNSSPISVVPDADGSKKRYSLPVLREVTPPRWRHLVDKAERGSVKAMIRLACGDCVAWELKEARECELRACPLHAVNPWLRSRRAGRQAESEPEPTTTSGGPRKEGSNG
jgi:hypothetical protein